MQEWKSCQVECQTGHVDNIHTQQDALEKFASLVSQYDYNISQTDASCTSTYVGLVSDSDIVIGCVAIEKNTIKHLRVKKEFQRKHFGTELLHRAEKIVKKRGYSSSITYVHYKNNIALKFFKSHKYFIMWCGAYYYALEKKLG